MCGVLALMTGCTGLEPGMIGVGMTAVQQGVTYVSGVDSYSFQPASFGDTLAAATQAGESLGLELYNNRAINETHTELRFRFDKDDRLVVEIEHQTDRVTLVQLNVKKKSRRGMGALYMRAITHELRKAGAYFGDWKDNMDLIGGV